MVSFRESISDKRLREYAERFLDAYQIDKIDWNEIPGVSPELAAHLTATEQSEERL